jgi:hypothetical protein
VDYLHFGVFYLLLAERHFFSSTPKTKGQQIITITISKPTAAVNVNQREPPL